MFCVCGLRRFRRLTQAHFLESLRDVNGIFSKNCLSSQLEQPLLISRSCSSKQELFVHDPLKNLARSEQEQESFLNKQMHSYCHNIDASENVVSEDIRHKFIFEDEDIWPVDDASAAEDSSSAESESKMKEVDDIPSVREYVSKKKSKGVRTSPQYPLLNMGHESKTFTSNFEKSEKILQSLNVPTFELPHYPDIQEMSEEELHLCIRRLNEIGIRVVFSLFLIQRMATEIELEHTAKRASLSHNKNWFKLRNGKYRLTSLQAVSLYLKLCKLMENPELDLYQFINDLASVNVYEPLNTVVSKVQQLRSVGATPQQIVSNLALLKGCNIFKLKIQLYQNLFRNNRPLFPVNLFLSSTMTEFREKLHVGQDVNIIANLLGVTPNNFLMCWGFKLISTSSLIPKIHLCLQAGISKQDLFNNINMINRLSLNKCQAKVQSLLKSGHSISLYELKALEDDIDPDDPDIGPAHKDWTSEDQSDPGVASLVDTERIPKENALNKRNPPKAKHRRYQSMETSKIWRMEVFKLISHHLQLDLNIRKAMFKSNVSVDSIDIQDITQNLDFLMSTLKFTKEQISACPLILAHPHEDLYRVTQEVKSLLEQHFAWSPMGCKLLMHNAYLHDGNFALSSESEQKLSSSSASLSPLSLSSASFTSVENVSSRHVPEKRSQSSNLHITHKHNDITHSPDYSILLTDPVTHLNILQYFLEKETGFSMLSTDSLL